MYIGVKDLEEELFMLHLAHIFGVRRFNSSCISSTHNKIETKYYGLQYDKYFILFAYVVVITNVS